MLCEFTKMNLKVPPTVAISRNLKRFIFEPFLLRVQFLDKIHEH